MLFRSEPELEVEPELGFPLVSESDAESESVSSTPEIAPELESESDPASGLGSALLAPLGIIGIAPATPAVGTEIMAAAATPSAYLEIVCLRIGNKTYLYFNSHPYLR